MRRTFTVAIALLCTLLSMPPINGAPVESLVSCLQKKGVANYTVPTSPYHNFIWDFSLQNLRFSENGVARPAAIILPSTVEEVESAWFCVRATGLAMRVRNGGHSYEGLSSTATAPFVIIDLLNLSEIRVNAAKKWVWIGSGARVGEVYYAVAAASSNTLGLSAGTCSTIGLSGHLMGGGYGVLSRKYGVAADNLLDAQVITANGTLIKEVSTADPELFWALRGGGGGAWGIVVAWKLKLVEVPAVLTTFRLQRNGKRAVTDLVYRWQSVAPAAPPELFIAVYMAGIMSSDIADMEATFYGQHWGTINQTVTIFNSLYPELGLAASDCKQGSWIQATAIIALLSEPSELLEKQQPTRNYFKAKSDYVSKPLSKRALSGAFDIVMKNPLGWVIFEPYGGVMSEISSDAIAFPHRAGNLYMVQYQAVWANDTNAPDDELITWLRGLYSYMAPFVTYTPALSTHGNFIDLVTDSRPSRSTYVNYIDLDLGDGVAAGKSYFGPNFAKLVRIKAKIDPFNVFNQPQSVPVSV